MDIDNCAILMPDVLADAGNLLDSRRSATPVEFHALNSLVEAVVVHEKLYLYDWPTRLRLPNVYHRLVADEIIHPEHSPRLFDAELIQLGMKDVAAAALEDRVFSTKMVVYHVDGGLSQSSWLIEYEKRLGFEQMSTSLADNEAVAISLANTSSFTDAIAVDGSYRQARAFAACASELGLEMYTGIVSRSFLVPSNKALHLPAARPRSAAAGKR